MRCLLVSDLHYTLKQFDWLLNVADHYDLVVIAGDHLDISSSADVRAQIAVILSYMRRLCEKTRLIVCSGNHDLDLRNTDGEKCAKWIHKTRNFGVPTDGDCLLVKDTLITICPWWDGPLGCKKVAAQLHRDSLVLKQSWIWIYHAPPDASPTSWGGRQHFGDKQLSQWITTYQPQMVFAGHIHQSPFRTGGSWADKLDSTWVFNPGRQIGPIPAHIILDMNACMAAWFSLAGAEAVALDQPLVRPITALTEQPTWLK